MIYICTIKTLVRFSSSTLLDSTIPKSHFYALQTHPLFPSLRFISTCTNQHSFPVNYLINSCGLSPKTAISASQRFNFKTLENPDSVLDLFKSHGFCKTQISNIIKQRPQLLLWNPKKTLLPKFDFLYSTGISSTELPNIICSAPTILARSLKNQIIPTFNMLKNLFHSEDKFMAAFKRYPHMVVFRRESTFSNIELLIQQGVPKSNIGYLLIIKSRAIGARTDRLNEVVETVEKMGFNASKIQFVIAINALMIWSKSNWNCKMEVYKKCGWSEEETMLAFRKYPWCMMISEQKIVAMLSYCVNTMGWEASIIARYPQLTSLSLGKRIIPRCSVLQVLLLKGLVKEPISLTSLLCSTESLFLKKFVTCYEEAPQLLKLYQEKMDIAKVTQSR